MPRDYLMPSVQKPSQLPNPLPSRNSTGVCDTIEMGPIEKHYVRDPVQKVKSMATVKSAEQLERESVFLQAVSFGLLIEGIRRDQYSTNILMGYLGDANVKKHRIPAEKGPVEAAAEFVECRIRQQFPEWAKGNDH